MNSHLKRLILILLPVLCLTGCDNSVKMVEEEGRIYSIYGALDLLADTNFVRVHNMNKPLMGDSTRQLDATVTLRNLETGQTEVLQDSVVRFEDVFTHNFISTSDIIPGDKYMISSEHPSGQKTEITATMPPMPKMSVTKEDCNTEVTVRFDPANIGDLTYRIGYEYKEQMQWVLFDDQIVVSEETSTPLDLEVIQDGSGMYLKFRPETLLNPHIEKRGLYIPPTRVHLGPPRECYELSSEFITIDYRIIGLDFYQNVGETAIRGDLGRFGGYYDTTFTFPIDTTRICSTC